MIPMRIFYRNNADYKFIVYGIKFGFCDISQKYYSNTQIVEYQCRL